MQTAQQENTAEAVAADMGNVGAAASSLCFAEASSYAVRMPAGTQEQTANFRFRSHSRGEYDIILHQ